MTSTRNRKAKRGKTRRTRRKTRTTHTGGRFNWKLWGKDNTVVPEPTTTLKEVSNFLLRNDYPNTFRCLEDEHKIKVIATRYDTPIYPCQSSPAQIAPVQESRDIISESNPVSEPISEKYTEKNPNQNGWYIEVVHDGFGDTTLIKNENLKNMSGDPGNINNFGNSNFKEYMDTINVLPNPSYSYSTNIEGVSHTFSLRSNDGGGHLLWVDSKTHRIMYYYNTAKPLTISINGTEYTLTKV
jgi:hypothetical protein